MFKKWDLNEIANLIKSSSPHTGIYIGCDSSQKRDYCIFATVVVIHHDKSKGANVFVKVEKTQRIQSTKQRVMMEVYKAVETALLIHPLIPKRTIEIHLDINSSSSYLSNLFLKEAFGYVSSQGFIPVFKPQSFAAYCVADYICKKY
ncbi:MAG: ribonuclease H-like YkuK family protein [Brevinematia bacterium]